MWTKMNCLESDVQWHEKKVKEIQAEAKALEAAKQKNEASVTEESEADSSSEEDAGCVGCQKLQKQIGKMWTKMSCLESDVQWHAKKVAEIQAEAKAGARKRRKVEDSTIVVNAHALNGEAIFKKNVCTSNSVSKIVRSMYKCRSPGQMSTIALTHTGRTLSSSETFEQFKEDEVTLSCVCISALQSIAGLQGLRCNPGVNNKEMKEREGLVNQWATVYKGLLPLDALKQGDALAYMIFFLVPPEHECEHKPHCWLEHDPEPWMLALKYEVWPEVGQAWSNDTRFSISATWSICCQYKNKRWDTMYPSNAVIGEEFDVHTWDPDTMYESVEDVIDDVFHMLHMQTDDTSKYVLVWPEQHDGTRLNFITKCGHAYPLMSSASQ